MTNLLLSPEVVIRFLTESGTAARNAALLLTMGEDDHLNLYLCASDAGLIYSQLCQYETPSKVNQKLNGLQQFVKFIPVDEAVLISALKSNYDDLNLAVRYYAALYSNTIDVIISEDNKSLKNAKIAVMSPESYVKTNC